SLIQFTEHRGLRLLCHRVLNSPFVIEDGDLGAARALTDHHGALDGLAARQELGLGDHVAAAARVTTLTAALLLGLQSGRALDGLELVAGLKDQDDSVRTE